MSSRTNLALAILRVERDVGVAEEVVAGAMAAVEIAGRRFDRQVNVTERVVGRDYA